jgi:Ca2+-binding RTX toxin-like protein
VTNISQAQVDDLRLGSETALGALNAAFAAQALAETLPLIGDGLSGASNDATQVLADLRTALSQALSTLSSAATYSAAEIEVQVSDALDALGFSGVLVSASAGVSGVTLTLGASADDTTSLALAGDLALPGMALAVSGSADLDTSAQFSLTMGVDAGGFYFATGGASQLDLALGTSAVYLQAAATLGALGFTVADAGSDLDIDLGVVLTDANNDGKLRLSELGSDFIDVTASGSADVVLDLAADFGNGALPSVSGTLDVDWDFLNASVDPYDQNISFGGLPTVALRDVTLDLGTFLEDVMLPILEVIEPLLEPIRIALDVVTADISMLKLLPNWENLLDLNDDGAINLLDLLRLADDTLDLGPIEDFIDLAQTVVGWADFLAASNLSAAGLNFGDFELGAGEDIRDLSFDIALADLDLATVTETLGVAVSGLGGGDWDGPGGGKDILQDMIDGAAFRMPILQDPTQVLSLFFGGDADLVEIDFPEVGVSAGSETLVQIPVFPGINVALGGSISAAFDLGFGYSTRGLTMAGGSALTALNGLYVIDGEGAEAAITASINLGASVDVLLASLYGGGDVSGTIELDIADALQSTPGRLYFDEFATALTTNPFSLFDASGSITAGLSLSAKVLGGDLFRLDSPRSTLADFNFEGRAALTSATDPLGLASLDGGVLALNIGPDAGNRLVGSATDGNEIVNITAAAAGWVTVSINGYSATYGSGTRIEADAGQGNDQVALAASLAVAASISGNAGDDLLAGGALGDTLDGGANNDTLFGQDGDDSLTGGDGDDLFYGGAGADTIAGGLGQDIVSYVLSGVAVNVDLGTGTATGGIAEGDRLSGIDILQGSQHDDTLSGADGVAEMIIGLGGDDSIRGGSDNDALLGSAGADTLDGGLGADTLVGAAGDDVYFVDDAGDVVDEDRFGEIMPGDLSGTDEVRAALDWSIATGTQATQIEDLTLIGAAVVGAGNQLDNVLTANAAGLTGGQLHGAGGDDTLIGSAAGELLDGGTGADDMTGFGGDDTYQIDNSDDDIIEAAGAGSDTAIVALSSFALEGPDDIEVLRLDAAINGGLLIANALDQTVMGADGDDTLVGDAGGDALQGGDGIDRASYRTSAVGVAINLLEAVQSGGHAEGDTYTSIEQVEGSAQADTLLGSGADDYLLGLDGDDRIKGRGGNDTLFGGAGADLLDGGGGTDNLIGEDGDDTYRVDNMLDVVVELGTGVDLVEAAVDWALSGPTQQNVENLTLTGAARQGTGNALDNVITGTGGDDTLDGLAGDDTMIGGAGDDLYIVDNALDLITDTSGSDRIDLQSANVTSYDMSVQAGGVEHLDVVGNDAAVTVTGNALGNRIIGNARSDRLYGGAGDDTLIAGGGGTERLFGGTGNDDLQISLTSRGAHVVDGGVDIDVMRIDWVDASSTVSLIDTSGGSYYRTFVSGYGYVSVTFEGIESFDLRFGAGSDVLYGGTLDDTLHGGGGNDFISASRGQADVSGGTGLDFASVTVRTAEDVDLGLDFSLRLIDTQTGAVTVNAGTDVQTTWEGLEQIWLYTGAGDDLLDTRGVASTSLTHSRSNYFSSGDGNDHFATDLSARGTATFAAGEGYDLLTLDWSGSGTETIYFETTGGTYFRTHVNGYGYVYQYVTDIEELDIQTGAGSDNLKAIGGRDRFETGLGNDEVIGVDKGDTVLAGAGSDWISLDLRFDETETDPAENIELVLAEIDGAAVTYFAGTEDETQIEGLEQIWLYTGAGDDLLDTRGVASTSLTHSRSNYFSSGDGNDHFATDLSARGTATFAAGEGYDLLTLDWSGSGTETIYFETTGGTYFRTHVNG